MVKGRRTLLRNPITRASPSPVATGCAEEPEGTPGEEPDIWDTMNSDQWPQACLWESEEFTFYWYTNAAIDEPNPSNPCTCPRCYQPSELDDWGRKGFEDAEEEEEEEDGCDGDVLEEEMNS